MKVTRLKPSVRRPGFVTVFVDEARLAVLPIEDIRGLALVEGVTLDERQREGLETAAERVKAYDAAVRLLAVRGRSRQEVITRLRRKGVGKDAVAHAVGRLEGEGLLDDAEFAREFARAKAERGFGRARILAELSGRGVGRRDAELAAAGAAQDDPDVRRDQLLALATKRAGQLRGLGRAAARRRLTAFLARRGHTGSEVWEIVDLVLAPRAPDADGDLNAAQ